MASSDELREYLEKFTRVAREQGLEMLGPGKNWARARDLVPGSHVSLSVRRDQIQVNLNNEQDEERRRFRLLFEDRVAIERALGCELVWEQKEGRKKTAVRATRAEGFETGEWERQFIWGVTLMKGFEQEFGERLEVSS